MSRECGTTNNDVFWLRAGDCDCYSKRVSAYNVSGGIFGWHFSDAFLMSVNKSLLGCSSAVTKWEANKPTHTFQHAILKFEEATITQKIYIYIPRSYTQTHTRSAPREMINCASLTGAMSKWPSLCSRKQHAKCLRACSCQVYRYRYKSLVYLLFRVAAIVSRRPPHSCP